MDPELEACFDRWEASLDALCRYMLDTTAGVTGPVTTSSATNELDITSEGMAPASSSSSSSPATSATEGVVSTELVPDNDDGEHGASLVSSSLPSSLNQFKAWEDASPTAPISCINSIEGGDIVPVDAVSTAIIAEVAALTCFKPERDTTFSPTCVTTEAQEGVTTAHVTCSTKGQSHDATTPALASTPAAALTSPMATVGVIPVLTSVAAGYGTLDCEPVKGAGSTAPTQTTERSLAFTPGVPLTASSAMPATTAPLMVWPSFLTSATPSVRCHGLLLRPMPWPSFLVGQLNATENRPRPWSSFTSSCGGRRQKQCHAVQLQTAVQDAPNGLTAMSVYDVYEEEQQETEQPHIYAGSSAASFSDMEWLPVCTQNIYVCWESDSVPHQVQFVQQIRYHVCLSLVAGACKHVMEFGIQQHFSFASDKSQVAFSVFPDGPVNPYAQRLQTLVQLNYQDQNIDLKSVCNLCVKIFKQTCEERYGLALFQLEIAWQLGTMYSERKCYYPVFKGKEVLDMQLLRLFNIAVSSGYDRLVYEPVIIEFRQLNLLYCYQASNFHPEAVLELLGSTYSLFSGATDQNRKIQSYMKISYSDHCQVGMYFKVGHLFYHVVQYTTQGGSRCGNAALYPSFPTCTGMRMEQSKGSDELIQWLTNNPCGSGISTIKSIDINRLLSWVFMDLDGAANQHWKIYWDLGDAFRIWQVAWTADHLKIARGRGQVPFQGGRSVKQAVFTDQTHVSQDCYIAFTNQILVDSAYYLEQAYYLDMVCSDIISYRQNSHHDSSKTKEIHMPWDPGKSSSGHSTPKIWLGDKPIFKEGGMLGPSPCAYLIGPVPWARSERLGPAHSQLQIHTYIYPTRGTEEGIQKDQERHGGGPSLPPRL